MDSRPAGKLQSRGRSGVPQRRFREAPSAPQASGRNVAVATLPFDAVSTYAGLSSPTTAAFLKVDRQPQGARWVSCETARGATRPSRVPFRPQGRAAVCRRRGIPKAVLALQESPEGAPFSSTRLPLTPRPSTSRAPQHARRSRTARMYPDGARHAHARLFG